MTSSMKSKKIAIIGGGPRGLWAAEELCAQYSHARRRDNTQPAFSLDVRIYDRFPPGAGAVYRIDQPRQWRLNAHSSVVETAAGSLDDWRLERASMADCGIDKLDPFPPRAEVGEFLTHSWQWLLDHAPASVQLSHVPFDVHEVVPLCKGFSVDGERFDEVLVVTGHPHDHAGSLQNQAGAVSRVPITQVYWGTKVTDLPEPPSRFGVRGAALTFIDLCLLYGSSAEVLYPVNRSGRFMEVKPGPDIAEPTFTEELHTQVRSAQHADGIRAALADAAIELIGADPDQVSAVLEGRRGEADGFLDPIESLRHSLAAATGAAPLTAAGAVGAAFRGMYQDAVDNHRERRAAGLGPLPGFAALARALEPLAFGPPPVTARTLLDLCEAGTVDCRFLGAPNQIDRWAKGEGPVIDTLVDATLAPQGLPHPFADVPGLTAIGRMNEPVLPGHDSLKRNIHDDIPHWAAKVVIP